MVGTALRPSSHHTTLLMSMGQFIDHDLDHVPVIKGGTLDNDGVECCNGGFFKDDLTAEESIVCFPIRIPPNDPMFRNKKTCLNFVRSVCSPQLTCQPGPLQQVTNYAGMIYASRIVLQREKPFVNPKN